MRRRKPRTHCRGGNHDLRLPHALTKDGRCLQCRRESRAAERASKVPTGRPGFQTRIDIDMDKVLELRNRGLSLLQIADSMGLTYATLSKRTAAAGICFTRGMTPERWLRRRQACANATDAAQARMQLLWADYLDAAVEEESLPHFLRGKASRILAAMNGRAG